MNPEETEIELLGAIEEVAPDDNVPYDENDDGIDIETEVQNDAESKNIKKKNIFKKFKIRRKSWKEIGRKSTK